MTFLNSVLDESQEKILYCYINISNKNQIIQIISLGNLLWEKVVFSGQRLLFEAVFSDQLEIKIIETVTAKIPCYERRVMESLENIREFLTSYLEMKGRAWWVEIVTQKPNCIYYVKPFASSYKAQLYSGGYIEDLKQEKAQVIAVDINRGQPGKLTIVENELGDRLEGQLSLAISSFVESRFY